MAQRKRFVGGNWKSNNTLEQSKQLVQTVYNQLNFDENKVDVIAAPVFIHLSWALDNVQKKVQIAAQNVSQYEYGAYTGEISANHIKDLGLNWVILGHSERRAIYNESEDLVAKKTVLALSKGLKVIFCIGEKLEEREAGHTSQVVESQLKALISLNLTAEQWDNIVIAYEPVWAIGTGKTATPEQAQEVHLHIRKFLATQVSEQTSSTIRIIYGGSVTDQNSDQLISQPDIDGFLVGGASLKPAFAQIVQSCNK